MPHIISKLPFFDRTTSQAVPGGTVSVLPFQIVLSTSITRRAERALHPRAPRFPALLDTAFNNTFLIREEHLIRWAGLQLQHFPPVDEITAYGQKVPVVRANVWLQPNVPGKREDDTQRPPFCIQLDPGIAVCPRGMTQPRLPLLGMRALFVADLQMSFHWRKLRFSLRTTPWWHWLLG
jgi:hypothetical protein